MPSNDSTKKRVRQNKKRNLRNKIIKKKVKTAVKKVTTSENAEDKQKSLNQAYSLLDKSQRKNIYHKNKVARIKRNLSTQKEKTE
ncbi:MAG: hypothetical protein APR63_01925 [Desulfuromonas sp. SDB]|nr:MAG: hypothetical protein APR63_01925 [Desulfuromonas sp. SDB]